MPSNLYHCFFFRSIPQKTELNHNPTNFFQKEYVQKFSNPIIPENISMDCLWVGASVAFLDVSPFCINSTSLHLFLCCIHGPKFFLYVVVLGWCVVNFKKNNFFFSSAPARRSLSQRMAVYPKTTNLIWCNTAVREMS